MNIRSIISTAAIAIVLQTPLHGDDGRSIEPAPDFDIGRYLGAWHEIALIPNSFQNDCVAGTTAEYTKIENSSYLKVLNSCIEASGERELAEGRARPADTPDNGALEVTFASVFGLWLWPIAGDYVVIGLDSDYQWSAVGSPSRDYGWVLAREERLGEDDLARIASVFRDAGYDPCRLLMSPRTAGDARTPLCEAY